MFFQFEIGLSLIDLNYTFLMKSSEFKISLSIESYDKKKYAENHRNCFDVEKRIVSKITKISIPNVDSTNGRLDSRLCQNLMYLSLIISEKPAVKEEIYIFFHPVQHNSRSLRSVDQSTVQGERCENTNYSGRSMRATIGVCFRFLTLLVIELYDRKMSGNWKNVKKIVIFNRPHDR